MSTPKKLGEILVDRGIVTPLTVERILAVSKKHNKRFGVMLEEMGIATGRELAEALAEQFSLPVIDEIDKFYIPPEVLRLSNPEFATQHLIIPLSVCSGALHLALADPTEMKIARNLAANNDLTLVPFVASRQDIYRGICWHYLGTLNEEPTERTVLVVDDDALYQNIIEAYLKKHGYRVLTARDGMEGFKEVIAKRPHVIITDKVMPKFDGFSLFKSLKANPETRSVPVILISGHLGPGEEGEAFDLGFFDFVPKPINETTLLTRVKRAFWFYDHNYSLF